MPKLIALPDQSEPKASLNLPCQIEDVRATCAAHHAIIGGGGWVAVREGGRMWGGGLGL